MAEELDQLQLHSALAGVLKDWRVSGQALQRNFVFRSFPEAIRFVNRLAEHAEEMNHHPDLDIRYNQVTVSCLSHDKGRITQQDLMLAGYANEAASTVEFQSDAA